MSNPARSLAAPALLAVTLAVAACAGTEVSAVLAGRNGAVVEAPQYRVGDRWVYRIRDGYRVARFYDETHTVTGIGADGITVRVTMKGPELDAERTERWPVAGQVAQGSLFDIETRRFATPLLRYRFPMQSGGRWNQFVDNHNELTGREGQINRYVRVGGFDKVTTPAGTFDAIRLNIIMRLDDDEFWRWPTDCTYTVWYAPSAKAAVREVRRADYLEKGSGIDDFGRLPAQNALIELVSFTPGG